MIPFYRYLEVGTFSMLNLMPFLLLAIYPFRRYLRFSRFTTSILVLVMTVFQLGMGCLAAFTPIGSGVMSLISTVIYASFYFFVVKDQFGRLAFVLLVFSNLGNLVTVCAKCLEGLVFGSIALEPYRWTMLVCMLIMHVIITVPVFFYVRKYFTSNVLIQNKSWNYLWIIPATFYITWYYHLYLSGESSVMVALNVNHALFLLMINLGAFVVYHTVILLLFEQKKSATLMQNNYLLALRNVQHENLQQRINEARLAKHDVHHHTHLIREYLRDGKLQELEAYLDQYSASLPDTQSLAYCQHYEANTLLNYFVQQAKQQGIGVEVFVQFPEIMQLPRTTLSVLLGNLMENAITACSSVASGEKKITIRGKSQNGFVFLDVSNPYSGILKKAKTGEYFSTKAGGHGLGLSSVAHLADSHNGILEVDDKNNIFRVSVMLQEHSSTDTTLPN